MYARQGDWTKCLNLAEKQSPKMLPHYPVQFCKVECHKGDVLSACQSLVRYGPPQEASNNALYRVIIGELLGGTDGTGPSLLREMLVRLIAGPTSVPPPPKAIMDDIKPQANEFHKALFAAHYMTIRARLKEQNQSPSLQAKLSVSLCR